MAPPAGLAKRDEQQACLWKRATCGKSFTGVKAPTLHGNNFQTKAQPSEVLASRLLTTGLAAHLFLHELLVACPHAHLHPHHMTVEVSTIPDDEDQ
jgi:hypothetical protein